MLAQIKRLLCQVRGEKMILVAFWPHDYALGQVYTVGGDQYRITRYIRSQDQRFFEVWGTLVAAPLGHRNRAKVEFSNA